LIRDLNKGYKMIRIDGMLHSKLARRSRLNGLRLHNYINVLLNDDVEVLNAVESVKRKRVRRVKVESVREKEERLKRLAKEYASQAKIVNRANQERNATALSFKLC